MCVYVWALSNSEYQTDDSRRIISLGCCKLLMITFSSAKQCITYAFIYNCDIYKYVADPAALIS